MTSIAIEGTKLDAAQLVAQAKRAPMILTKKGKPVCAVVEIEDFDREAWSLGSNTEFIALLEESRKSLREHGGIPLEEVRRELGIASKKKRRPGRSPKR